MTEPMAVDQRSKSTSSPYNQLNQESSQRGSVDENTSSPTHGQKRSADHLPQDGQVGRKGRACLACRKLKVKCDSLERGDAGCSRCHRLGLECVTSKRLRVSLEDEREQMYPSITKLDRAVEDILARLKMPPLESYTRLQAGPDSIAQTTRENSREPMPDGEHDIGTAPMGSLYEVTQLNTLRSRLKHGDQGRRSSRRKMEADLISQGVLSIEEAEEMLTLFKTSLSRYLFDATISEDRTLTSVRESSTLFFTAIMVVSSLHIPGKEKIHALCHKQLRDLIAASMFDRFHTLEDIRALCIAAFWVPDLSWKLSGHCVRMATELNLHQAFYKAFYSQNQTLAEREHAFEKARLWYLLYVLDHHFSIAYGRPPVTAELQAIKEYETFLHAPECSTSDRRVLSQVSLFIILSKAYNVFGLEAERLIEGEDQTLLTHLRFIEDLERWKTYFRHSLSRDPHVGDYPAVGVELHYNFANLMLNSLALRGRSLDTISTLPLTLRPLALRAIESAHNILQIVLQDSSIRYSLVGVPLYLHTMIAFAAVFLIKMSSRWTMIGVTIDPAKTTKPLIQGIIDALRECKAGSNHILYSMATGFERLLHSNAASGIKTPLDQGGQQVRFQLQDYDRSNSTISGGLQNSSSTLQPPTPTSLSRTNGSGYYPAEMDPNTANAFTGWSNEPDVLWSMGMGYDLLSNAPDVNSPSFAMHDMLYPQMQ